MKKIATLLVGLLMVAFVLGQASAQDEEKPFVHRLQLVGKGFGIPTDGNLDNLKWVNKIAVGAVKHKKNIKRVGVMHVTDSDGDHRYHIKNISFDNVSSVISASIYGTGKDAEKIGSMEVSRKTISGKEAWAGSLTLGNWSGNLVLQGHKIKIKKEHRDRVIKEEKEIEDCESDDDCEFKHHLRNADSDARSRDFIRDKCETDSAMCKKYLEKTEIKAEIRSKALNVLSSERLKSLRIAQKRLDEIEKEVTRKLLESRERLTEIQREAAKKLLEERARRLREAKAS